MSLCIEVEGRYTVIIVLFVGWFLNNLTCIEVHTYTPSFTHEHTTQYWSTHLFSNVNQHGDFIILINTFDCLTFVPVKCVMIPVSHFAVRLIVASCLRYYIVNYETDFYKLLYISMKTQRVQLLTLILEILEISFRRRLA